MSNHIPLHDELSEDDQKIHHLIAVVDSHISLIPARTKGTSTEYRRAFLYVYTSARTLAHSFMDITIGRGKINSTERELVLRVLEKAATIIPEESYPNDVVEIRNNIAKILQLPALLITPNKP